ncbi:MAG: hypothetical protein ACRES7_09805, partial [Gammaproteobacteria bacterium]
MGEATINDQGTAWCPVRLTVGVTAHRDLIAAEESEIESALGDFFDALARRFPDTPLQALCPLAEGGERIFARVALARGIPLLVPLPLPPDYYLEDFADAASRREFDELAGNAKVFVLPHRPGVSWEQVSEPGVLRDSEYAQLGVFVSSHSQILIAIWDGKPSQQLGGTAQIVRYRLSNVYPAGAAIRPIGREVLADDENDLTFHIACSRNRPNGAPATPLEPLQTTWLTGDLDRQSSGEIPAKYARVVAMTTEFNRDCARLDGAREPAAIEDVGQAGGIHHIEQMFAAADRLSNYFQRRLNFALRTTYTLAVLMGGAFVGYSTIPNQQPLLYVFLALFALGFCLYEIARRGDWHRKYLDYRVLAEGLRVQYFWAMAGVGNTGDGRFVHENFLQKQDPELGWIRHVMRDAELRAQPPEDAGDAGLRFAVENWVGGTSGSLAPGQLGYYAHKADQHSRLHGLTERIGTLCLWSGIAIAIALAIFANRFSHATRTVMLLLLGLLPLIAAVRGAYAHKRADKELIK